jgi:hypothetical protein
MKGLLILLFSILFTTNTFATNCETPVSNDRFVTLYESISIKLSDAQKFKLIKDYMNRECFSVVQLNKCLGLISERKLKVSLTHEVYHSIYDKENLKRITAQFTDHEIAVIEKNIKK